MAPVRDFLPTLLVAVVVILLGVAGYVALFDDDSVGAINLQRVSGDVEVHSRQGSGAGVTGQVLEPGDRVIANEGGQAVLAFGEASSIVLEERSSLKVRGAGEDGVEVELEGGRARAVVRAGDGTLGVLNGDRRVEASDATFQVGVDPDGALAVGTEEGTVALQGFGDREGLGPGERISLVPGGDPWVSDAERDLLLEVDPAKALIARREQTLTGTSDPGARLRIEGGLAPVEGRADGDGAWRLTVALSEGDNNLTVTAVDALGEETTVDWTVVVDTRPPEAVEIVVGGP